MDTETGLKIEPGFNGLRMALSLLNGELVGKSDSNLKAAVSRAMFPIANFDGPDVVTCRCDILE